jgi:Insertion element 4 transposase N-terminal
MCSQPVRRQEQRLALMIRQIAQHDPLSTPLALDALARVVPAATVAAGLAECGATGRRTRKLPGLVTTFFCIAMSLHADDCLAHVFRPLVLGLRRLWPDPAELRVSKGALCQARYRLGVRPLALLFRRVCRPLATPATPGACRFGLRLLALDGPTLDVPDTAANGRAVGRQRSPRGAGAWPRVQLVALSECGTHAICDAGVWRWDADERAAGRRLLRAVGRGTLLLGDRGFPRCVTIAATRATGAPSLGRLPATDKPLLVRTLSDGSQLVRLRPGDYHRRRRGETVLARLIRYTRDDPGRPGHGVEHRLVTSLLNPRLAPAEEVVVADHARGEFELAADEVKTHQRPAAPLRRRKPRGVLQEVYALLIAH